MAKPLELTLKRLFYPTLLVSLLVCASCKRSEPKPDAALRVGLAIPSYVHAVAWIAKDQNAFKAPAPEIQVMGGSAATVRAMTAGTIDIGIAGGDAVLKANAAGADLVVVAGLVDRFYHRLIVREGISKPEELRGKKIGLPFLGGPQDMAVRYALRDWKLEYGKDVKILNLGKEFNRIAALSRGDIDATMSQTPPSRLKSLGFSVLADLPAQDVQFPYAVVIVRRDFLEKSRERVGSFLGGLCEGIAFYRSERDKSLEIIQKQIRGSDTRQAAQERYKMSGPSLISWPPVPSAAGFEMVANFLEMPAEAAKVYESGVLDGLLDAGKCGGR